MTPRLYKTISACIALMLPAVASAQSPIVTITYGSAGGGAPESIPSLSTPALIAMALLLAVIAVRVLRDQRSHKLMSVIFAAGAIGIATFTALQAHDSHAGFSSLLVTSTGAVGTAQFNREFGCFNNPGSEPVRIQSITVESGYSNTAWPSSTFDCADEHAAVSVDVGRCSDSPGTVLQQGEACFVAVSTSLPF